jgi:hypothetical protein
MNGTNKSPQHARYFQPVNEDDESLMIARVNKEKQTTPSGIMQSKLFSQFSDYSQKHLIDLRDA